MHQSHELNLKLSLSVPPGTVVSLICGQSTNNVAFKIKIDTFPLHHEIEMAIVCTTCIKWNFWKSICFLVWLKFAPT